MNFIENEAKMILKQMLKLEPILLIKISFYLNSSVVNRILDDLLTYLKH